MLPSIVTLAQNARYALFAAVAIAFVVLAVSCGGDSGPEPADAAALCAATPEVAGWASDDPLVEVSGIASSRRNEDVIWAHNDSGDSARIFALGPFGNHAQTYTLSGAEAIDWEDMAIGPGPDENVDYLYLADIGDNAMQRDEVQVYRVPEPEVNTQADTPTDNPLDEVDKLTLLYPDRAHDAETLLVDPVSGDLLIVTKELAGGPSFVFRAPGALADGSRTTLEEVATINFAGLTSKVEIPPDAPPLVLAVPNLPTGGDVSPDGSLVIIRTYSTIWVWTRPKDAVLWQAFASPPCEAPSAIEPQGEAIAFDADGRGYVTISESDGTVLPVNHFTAR